MSAKRTGSKNYSQPSGPLSPRQLEGIEESIDYLPGHKYRIWYNDQISDFAPHRHSSLEIVICINETYTVTISDQVFKMRGGDILFIPPNSMHQISAPDSGERFILLFDLDFINNLYSQQMLTFFCAKPHMYTISSHPHLYPTAYATLMKIVSFYFKNESTSELSIYACLFELFTILCKSANQQANSLGEHHSDSYDKFVSILSYIDTNYADDLSLTKVAGTAGFSKYHFARIFKQYTNTTFYDYLCQKRILVAQQMLTDNLPVTEIAFQTGFNNLTTFSRCFHKYVGCSPSQYRSQFAAEEEKAIIAAAKLERINTSNLLGNFPKRL